MSDSLWMGMLVLMGRMLLREELWREESGGGWVGMVVLMEALDTW